MMMTQSRERCVYCAFSPTCVAVLQFISQLGSYTFRKFLPVQLGDSNNSTDPFIIFFLVYFFLFYFILNHFMDLQMASCKLCFRVVGKLRPFQEFYQRRRRLKILKDDNMCLCFVGTQAGGLNGVCECVWLVNF